MENLSRLLTHHAGRQLPEGEPIYTPNGALIEVMRRPGCQICLTQVRKLVSLYAEEKMFEKGINFCIIVHETTPESIQLLMAILPESATVLYDPNKEWNKAVLGHTKKASFCGTMCSCRFWRVVRASTEKGNLKGDGFTRGGCYVLGANGEEIFKFSEQSIGMHAAIEDVKSATDKLVTYRPPEV